MKKKGMAQLFAGDKKYGTPATHNLELYVAGATGNSLRAITNIKNICEKYFPGRYELQVIDVYLCPELAPLKQIVAIPTLIVKSETPEIRMVGDMSDTEKVLKGLKLVNSLT